MSRSTLFGDLALTFGAHPENIATEGLRYLLAKSPNACAALTYACSLLVQDIPSSLIFRSQVAGDDKSIPDLVGFDEAGAPRVVIEAKFWAGLTEHQPVTYLQRLLPGRPSVLLVVAPSLRFATLWPELLRRCQLAKLDFREQSAPSDEMHWARQGSDHALGLISWRSLLTEMMSRASAAGQLQTAAEIDQLLGLCDRMDADSFMPLEPGELAAPTPRRLTQLVQLLNDLSALCVSRGLANKNGLRAAGGGGWYGHYLRLRDAGVFLCLSFDRWATVRETPFWLIISAIQGNKWVPGLSLFSRLHALECEVPPRVLRDPWQSSPLVPLYLRDGMERQEILEDLFRQIEDVDAHLGDGGVDPQSPAECEVVAGSEMVVIGEGGESGEV